MHKAVRRIEQTIVGEKKIRTKKRQKIYETQSEF
jgi:hypothetical protein